MTSQPDPELYRRNVLDAEVWAKEHLTALGRVFGAFQAGGDWPFVEDLQRAIIRQGESWDLVAELAEMPPTIGVSQHSGEVSLSIRGLRQLPEATPLLERFVTVIRLAVERYRGEDEEPKITDGDLAAMGMDATSVAQVSALVFRESWPFGGGSGYSDGSWERAISLEIRHLVEVQTVDDYLRIQATLRYGPPPAPVTEESEAVVDGPPPPSESGTPGPASSAASPGLAAVPLSVGRSSAGLPGPIFARLVFKVLAKLKAAGYFIEAFEGGGWTTLGDRGEPMTDPPGIEDPEAWLMLNFGLEGLWHELANPRRIADQPRVESRFSSRGLLPELLELLHRDVVSRPVSDEEGTFEGTFDRSSGQLELRREIAPVLARLDPPMEMRSDGGIVPAAAPGLEDLADQPLPPSVTADDIRDKVQDAVRLFRDRTATSQDEAAALNQLAGVLERLRADRRLEKGVTGKDRAALFDIANNYAIRHDEPSQRAEYGPEFREWIFHSYLAAIRLTILVIDSEA